MVKSWWYKNNININNDVENVKYEFMLHVNHGAHSISICLFLESSFSIPSHDIIVCTEL